MKVTYKGFEIEARRERCMAGYKLLYYHVTRLSDRWVPIDSFEDSAETVRDMIGYMKHRVDDIIENPQDYEDKWTKESKRHMEEC
jgi:hypothetical protein